MRSAKAVKITDASLLKRLGVLCGCVAVALLVRTIVAPPVVVVRRTADDLKAFLCKNDWWDHFFTSSEYPHRRPPPAIICVHALRHTISASLYINFMGLGCIRASHHACAICLLMSAAVWFGRTVDAVAACVINAAIVRCVRVRFNEFIV